MGEQRRAVGFWNAVGHLRLADLFTFESLASILLGAGLGVWMFLLGDIPARVSLAGYFLTVVAALLGIVFAGLALVVALLSESYLRLLRSGPNGLLGFFRPFMLAIGLQVFTVIGTVVYLSVAPRIEPGYPDWLRAAELGAFAVLAVCFVASCLELVVLTRSVLMHALLRSELSGVADLVAQKERIRASGR